MMTHPLSCHTQHTVMNSNERVRITTGLLVPVDEKSGPPQVTWAAPIEDSSNLVGTGIR